MSDLAKIKVNNKIVQAHDVSENADWHSHFINLLLENDDSITIARDGYAYLYAYQASNGNWYFSWKVDQLDWEVQDIESDLALYTQENEELEIALLTA